MSTRVVGAVLVTPLLLAMLGGCVYRSKEVQTSTPSPVVMAPAPAPQPAPVVVPPAAPPVTAAVPSDRVVYPEGRWQLYGDGRSVPYYWVWIPTGGGLSQALSVFSSAASREPPWLECEGHSIVRGVRPLSPRGVTSCPTVLSSWSTTRTPPHPLTADR